MWHPVTSPLLKALGWALLNSIWQFAILAMVYWFLVSSFKKLSAAARHNLAFIILSAGTGWFFIGLVLQLLSPNAGILLITGNPLPSPTNGFWQVPGQVLSLLLPYASVVYLFCVLLLLLKLSFYIRRATQLQLSGTQKLSGEYRSFIAEVTAIMGIKNKKIRALISMQVDTPQVIGILKPVILLPFTCITQLTAPQLEAVLLHELVHIKRNDYLLNICIAGIEILFFFNPFVKFLIGSIRREREYSCDDWVLQFKYPPQQYATALLTLEKNRTGSPGIGIAASGKDKKQLLSRIERIVGVPQKTGMVRVPVFLMPVLLLVFIAGFSPITHSKQPQVSNVFSNTQAGILTANKDNPFSVRLDNVLKANTQALLKNAAAMKTAINTRSIHTTTTENEMDSELITVVQDGIESSIIPATQREQIDFSITDNVNATSPFPELSNSTPYIPANSFSYQIIADTNQPKLKGETFNEKTARASLIKAKKALDAIDWKKLEKSLGNTGNDLVKLKTVLEKEFSRLNWDKIDNEVQFQMNKEQFEQLSIAAAQQKALKAYQLNQAYLEALQLHLQEQDQLIKENDLRTQKTQQALEKEQLRLQNEMKKRKIVYL